MSIVQNKNVVDILGLDEIMMIPQDVWKWECILLLIITMMNDTLNSVYNHPGAIDCEGYARPINAVPVRICYEYVRLQTG